MAKHAAALGLHGWVRNRLDGSVEVLLQGPVDAVSRLQAWLHEGPPLARVDRVTATVLPPPDPPLARFDRHPTA